MDLTSSRHNLVGSVLMSMLVSTVVSIRVDWNTNTGPIVPAIPTERPVPQPPFREPASVWEDQSNDIPNPNPYRYVAPPPSRPNYRENTGFDLPNPNNIVQQNHFNSINPISNEIPHAADIGVDNKLAYFNNNNNNINNIPYNSPKYFKISGKYANDVYTAKYYSKYQKYNIIAYKDKYQNVPYYVFFFAKEPHYNWRQ